MRPIDHKLKYQIDKLVRTAVTGALGKTCFCRLVFCALTPLLVAAEDDPLQLRPNPENLISKVRPRLALLFLLHHAKGTLEGQTCAPFAPAE